MTDCDICNSRIRNYYQIYRLKIKYPSVNDSTMHLLNRSICKSCAEKIKDFVDKLKDRETNLKGENNEKM